MARRVCEVARKWFELQQRLAIQGLSDVHEKWLWLNFRTLLVISTRVPKARLAGSVSALFPTDPVAR
jgi:hypothetical protein